ncbi:MAG: hypothetical protein AAGA93_23200 [Actinomycetota bacterium]
MAEERNEETVARPAGAGRLTGRLLLLAPLVLSLAFVAVRALGEGDAEPSSGRSAAADVEPIDVVASGAEPATAEDLLAAGDLVIVATIASAEPGRSITDPQDPEAGIRTTLFELSVVETLTPGAGLDALVVEHETALLDGTPITVNGIAPPTVGQLGLYVLLGGSGAAFPHHALATPGSWARLDGGLLSAPPGAGSGHPLDGRSLDEARDVVAGR